MFWQIAASVFWMCSPTVVMNLHHSAPSVVLLSALLLCYSSPSGRDEAAIIGVQGKHRVTTSVAVSSA